MCHCIETIRIEDGRVRQLDYHQRRLDATRRELFPGCAPLDLRDAVPSALPPAGVYRLRVTYAEALEHVELEPYRRRTVRTLACVYVDRVDYRFKWADRRELQQLLQQRGDADEIIIVRDGLVTDSSCSNLALLGGNRWVTPDRPLLAGTMRARLLDRRAISEAPVPIGELIGYTHVALINALNPLGALVVPVGAVRL